ncbi:MAG: carboxypeptidase-like regulatory domain-containing protein [Deltaproteobacteria bacterium]|nr:carboxypeptidase-like regulatory domain-containing protein [Deltaproteobacteria bacterium]
MAGLVVDAGGHAVAGAVVAIRGATNAQPTIVIADDRGGFEQALPVGRTELRASAPGLAQAAATVVILAAGERQTVTLRLVAARAGVGGTVADLESGVLVGARVEARNLNALAGAPLVAVTDEHGAYHLALGDGAYVITARFEGYVEVTRRIAVASLPRIENFRLAPGATIRGRVLRAADRTPLGEACVRVDAEVDGAAFLPGAAPPCVLSGADGSFSIEGIAPGVARLTASAAGWGQPAPVDVALGIGEVRDGVELLVEPATTIAGRVVDQRDAPLSAVSVYAMRPDDLGRITAWGTTGDDGRFVLDGLTAGHYAVRTVPDQSRLAAASASIEAPTKDEVILRVHAGVTITGHVTPPRAGSLHVRQPLDRLAIDGLATATAAESMLTAPIDDTGAFTLAGVPAGTWEVMATTDDGGGAVTVTVADRDVTGVEIPVDQFASVCGVVREANGHALGDVTVTASVRNQPISLPATAYRYLQHGAVGSGVPVGEDGTFCVNGLAPAEYLLVVRDERQALMWSSRHLDAAGTVMGVTLAAGEHRTGFVLEVHRPLVTLRGHVVDERGAPVADALVSVDREGATAGGAAMQFPLIEQMDPAPPVVSDATGAFAIDVLPAPHRVTAELATRGLRGATAVVDPTQPAIVRVERAGVLRGTASGGSGTCRVAVRGVQSSTTIGVGADCAFAFDRLPVGHYVVRITRADAFGTASVDIAPGATATSAVTLETLATVEVRFIDEAGTGQPGLIAILVDDAGSAQSTLLETLAGTHPRSDRDGRVTLRAAAGDSTLGVLSSDGQRLVVSKQVSISAPVTDLGTLTVTHP